MKRIKKNKICKQKIFIEMLYMLQQNDNAVEL